VPSSSAASLFHTGIGADPTSFPWSASPHTPFGVSHPTSTHASTYADTRLIVASPSGAREPRPPGGSGALLVRQRCQRRVGFHHDLVTLTCRLHVRLLRHFDIPLDDGGVRVGITTRGPLGLFVLEVADPSRPIDLPAPRDARLANKI